MKKTWKRETAIYMLLYCAGCGVAAIFGYEVALEVLRICVVPSITFATAAFGLEQCSNIIREGRK